MQAVWTGTIAFGLVNIGVRVLAATESKSVTFRQIHRVDQGRIRHERVCTLENKPVPWDEVARGYETPDGALIQISDDDLAALPLPTARTIQVLEFVPLDEIDPIAYDRTYYLDPAQPTSVRPYVLLRDTLAASHRVAVTKVALRQRERLALLRVVGDAITLQTLLWPDEIRTPKLPHLATADQDQAQPPTQEYEMARMLVDALSSDTFDAAAYRDTYRDRLHELINAKLAGQEVTVPSPRGDTTGPDLLDLLQASIASAQARRDQETPPS